MLAQRTAACRAGMTRAPAQLGSDRIMDSRLGELLAPAGQLPEALLAQMAGTTLAFLLNAAKDEYTTDLAEASSACSHISGAQFRSVAQGLLIFLQNMLDVGADSLKVKEKCVAFGLSPAATNAIGSCWTAWAGKIATHLVSKVISKNKLVDMDWTFGVTASSEDCDHVGKTFLQLKLTLEQDNQERRVVFMELSLDQFYQFLASLEKCRSFLNYVSPR